MKKLGIYVLIYIVLVVFISFGIINIANSKMFNAIIVFAIINHFTIIFLQKPPWFKDSFSLLRGIAFSFSKRKLYPNLRLDQDVRFLKRQHIEFGDNCNVGRGASFHPVGGKFSSSILIGNNVYIGDYNRFASMNSVEIEDNVLFAAYVHITDHSHEYKDITLSVLEQGIYSKGPVKIGQGAWIGYASEILSGVKIGEQSVVAARSVVTHDVPPYSIVAGIPARVIKKYNHRTEKWVAVKGKIDD